MGVRIVADFVPHVKLLPVVYEFCGRETHRGSISLNSRWKGAAGAGPGTVCRKTMAGLGIWRGA